MEDVKNISLWVDSLQKSEFNISQNSAQSQLGLKISLTSYIEAAKFLTNKNIPFETVRQNFLSTDGDILQAVANAFGLTTPEDIKALEAVLQIRQVQKSLPEEPKDIHFLFPSAEDVLEDVKKAYNRNQVHPVSFKGKHSKNVFIAKDDDGIAWLIKVG